MPPPSGATAPPTAVVADDERLMRDQLIGRLKEAWPDLEIVGKATNGSEAVALVQREEPDIVFLDISMPGMDGIQAARAVAGQAHVVFVTAYDQYAVDAFELNAVDYLLKPFDRERFRAALERARSRIANPGATDVRAQVQAAVRQMLGGLSGGMAGNAPKRIVAEKNDRYIFVDPADVHAVEASRNYITLHVGNERLLLRCGMQQAESMLDPAMFLRIHRSVIVNTRHIKEMARQLYGDYEVTLSNGTKFSSGRAYRRRVVNYLNSGRF